MFARKSQLDELVDKATSELLTSEDWNQIMAICDLVPRTENGSRDCANAILRRINQKNAKVSCYAITLAEACVKNCGLIFHREIASSYFLNPIIKMVLDRLNTHFSVRERLLTFLQDCARDFSYDPSLNLMETEFRNLQRQGVEFPAKKQPEPKNQKDLQKEEEELQLALALSISEAETKKKTFSAPPEPKRSPPPTPTPKSEGGETIVKGLYDFAGADRGELGFKKGDLLIVLEKTHSGWWKGKLKHRPEATGLFPSNYVVEVASDTQASTPKKASDDLDENLPVESIDRLYDLLLAINPQKDNIAKNETIQELFQQCNEIRPKILQLIVNYEKKKADLIQLNDTFTKSKATYEKLLAASVMPKQQQPPSRDYGYAPQGAPQSYAPQAPYQAAPAGPPQPYSSQPPPAQQQQQQQSFYPPGSYPQYAPAPVAAPPSNSAPQNYQAPSDQGYYPPSEPQYPGYAQSQSGGFTPNAPPSSDFPPDNSYYAPPQSFEPPKDAVPIGTYYQEPPPQISSTPAPSATQPYFSSTPSFYPPSSSSAPASNLPPPSQEFGGYRAPPAASQAPPPSSNSYPPPSSYAPPNSSALPPSSYPAPSSALPQGQYAYPPQQQQQQQQPFYPNQQYPPSKPQEVSLIDLS